MTPCRRARCPWLLCYMVAAVMCLCSVSGASTAFYSLASRCPCLPAALCPHPFGSSPDDARLLGMPPACKPRGIHAIHATITKAGRFLVRCCGASTSVVSSVRSLALQTDSRQKSDASPSTTEIHRRPSSHAPPLVSSTAINVGDLGVAYTTSSDTESSSFTTTTTSSSTTNTSPTLSTSHFTASNTSSIHSAPASTPNPSPNREVGSATTPTYVPPSTEETQSTVSFIATRKTTPSVASPGTNSAPAPPPNPTLPLTDSPPSASSPNPELVSTTTHAYISTSIVVTPPPVPFTVIRKSTPAEASPIPPLTTTTQSLLADEGNIISETTAAIIEESTTESNSILSTTYSFIEESDSTSFTSKMTMVASQDSSTQTPVEESMYITMAQSADTETPAAAAATDITTDSTTVNIGDILLTESSVTDTTTMNFDDTPNSGSVLTSTEFIVRATETKNLTTITLSPSYSKNLRKNEQETTLKPNDETDDHLYVTDDIARIEMSNDETSKFEDQPSNDITDLLKYSFETTTENGIGSATTLPENEYDEISVTATEINKVYNLLDYSGKEKLTMDDKNINAMHVNSTTENNTTNSTLVSNDIMKINGTLEILNQELSDRISETALRTNKSMNTPYKALAINTNPAVVGASNFSEITPNTTNKHNATIPKENENKLPEDENEVKETTSYPATTPAYITSTTIEETIGTSTLRNYDSTSVTSENSDSESDAITSETLTSPKSDNSEYSSGNSFVTTTEEMSTFLSSDASEDTTVNSQDTLSQQSAPAPLDESVEEIGSAARKTARRLRPLLLVEDDLAQPLHENNAEDNSVDPLLEFVKVLVPTPLTTSSPPLTSRRPPPLRSLSSRRPPPPTCQPSVIKSARNLLTSSNSNVASTATYDETPSSSSDLVVVFPSPPDVSPDTDLLVVFPCSWPNVPQAEEENMTVVFADTLGGSHDIYVTSTEKAQAKDVNEKSDRTHSNGGDTPVREQQHILVKDLEIPYATNDLETPNGENVIFSSDELHSSSASEHIHHVLHPTEQTYETTLKPTNEANKNPSAKQVTEPAFIFTTQTFKINDNTSPEPIPKSESPKHLEIHFPQRTHPSTSSLGLRSKQPVSTISTIESTSPVVQLGSLHKFPFTPSISMASTPTTTSDTVPVITTPTPRASSTVISDHFSHLLMRSVLTSPSTFPASHSTNTPATSSPSSNAIIPYHSRLQNRFHHSPVPPIQKSFAPWKLPTSSSKAITSLDSVKTSLSLRQRERFRRPPPTIKLLSKVSPVRKDGASLETKRRKVVKIFKRPLFPTVPLLPEESTVATLLSDHKPNTLSPESNHESLETTALLVPLAIPEKGENSSISGPTNTIQKVEADKLHRIADSENSLANHLVKVVASLRRFTLGRQITSQEIPQVLIANTQPRFATTSNTSTVILPAAKQSIQTPGVVTSVAKAVTDSSPRILSSTSELHISTGTPSFKTNHSDLSLSTELTDTTLYSTTITETPVTSTFTNRSILINHLTPIKASFESSSKSSSTETEESSITSPQFDLLHASSDASSRHSLPPSASLAHAPQVARNPSSFIPDTVSSTTSPTIFTRIRRPWTDSSPNATKITLNTLRHPNSTNRFLDPYTTYSFEESSKFGERLNVRLPEILPRQKTTSHQSQTFSRGGVKKTHGIISEKDIEGPLTIGVRPWQRRNLVRSHISPAPSVEQSTSNLHAPISLSTLLVTTVRPSKFDSTQKSFIKHRITTSKDIPSISPPIELTPSTESLFAKLHVHKQTKTVAPTSSTFTKAANVPKNIIISSLLNTRQPAESRPSKTSPRVTIINGTRSTISTPTTEEIFAKTRIRQLITTTVPTTESITTYSTVLEPFSFLRSKRPLEPFKAYIPIYKVNLLQRIPTTRESSLSMPIIPNSAGDLFAKSPLYQLTTATPPIESNDASSLPHYHVISQHSKHPLQREPFQTMQTATTPPPSTFSKATSIPLLTASNPSMKKLYAKLSHQIPMRTESTDSPQTEPKLFSFHGTNHILESHLRVPQFTIPQVISLTSSTTRAPSIDLSPDQHSTTGSIIVPANTVSPKPNSVILPFLETKNLSLFPTLQTLTSSKAIRHDLPPLGALSNTNYRQSAQQILPYTPSRPTISIPQPYSNLILSNNLQRNPISSVPPTSSQSSLVSHPLSHKSFPTQQTTFTRQSLTSFNQAPPNPESSHLRSPVLFPSMFASFNKIRNTESNIHSNILISSASPKRPGFLPASSALSLPPMFPQTSFHRHPLSPDPASLHTRPDHKITTFRPPVFINGHSRLPSQPKLLSIDVPSYNPMLVPQQLPDSVPISHIHSGHSLAAHGPKVRRPTEVSHTLPAPAFPLELTSVRVPSSKPIPVPPTSHVYRPLQEGTKTLDRITKTSQDIRGISSFPAKPYSDNTEFTSQNNHRQNFQNQGSQPYEQLTHSPVRSLETWYLFRHPYTEKDTTLVGSDMKTAARHTHPSLQGHFQLQNVDNMYRHNYEKSVISNIRTL